jgi:hypothetical protein
MTPLALTDAQLDALRLTAASLPLESRHAFLQLMAGIIDVQPVNDAAFAEALDASKWLEPHGETRVPRSTPAFGEIIHYRRQPAALQIAP